MFGGRPHGTVLGLDDLRRTRQRPSSTEPPEDNDESSEELIQEFGYAVGFRFVPPILSKAWGLPEIAAARALLEAATDEETEIMIRSYHPAFMHARGANDIGILVSRDGKKTWIVFDLGICIPFRDAGGLDIHYHPKQQRDDWMLQHDPLAVRPVRVDLIRHTLDPRRLVSVEDRHSLREMYPRSCGARVWATGLVQILYATKDALEDDRFDGAPRYIGKVPVQFDVMLCIPSVMDQANPNLAEMSVTDTQDGKMKTAYLGLRIVLPDGTPALTTVTHGFCKLPQTRTLWQRINQTIGFLSVIRDSLRRFRSPGPISLDLPFVSGSSPPTSNTSLGKMVWLLGRERALGQISHTYDNPSHTRPYPCGFYHDLSLITRAQSDHYFEDLPQLDSTHGVPLVDGWADISKALDGAPLFVPTIIAHTTAVDVSYGTLIGQDAQAELLARTQTAIAEGVQYTWNPETLSDSVSLLWRCCLNPRELYRGAKRLEDLPLTVAGQSGSLICLGKPTDATCKALVFQNFEVVSDNTPENKHLFNVKAGFILPRFIHDECTIDHQVIGLSYDEGQYATIPKAVRSSSPTRRTVTNPT